MMGMKKTYKGSCHCGAVQFEADIDLDQGTGKCNCSICAKTRSWSVIIKPDAFRLLSGQESLSDYQFGHKSCHHTFCKHCGVRPFLSGFVEEIGGEFVSINLAALDNIDPRALIDAPIRYTDGWNDQWWEVPAEIRHL